MRPPSGSHQRHQQHRPLDGHRELHAERSGEADLLTEAAEGEDGEICPMQGYGGYRSGGVPEARAASNKAFSPDEAFPRGVFFQCWIGGGRLISAEDCTARAASASSLYTRGGVGGPGMTLVGGAGSAP